MRLGFNLFNFARRQPSDAFNRFLESDPSLEAILGHEETEMEIRVGNDVLFKSIDAPKISKLISYITAEQPEDLPVDQACRFPFLAQEFFSNQTVQDTILYTESLVQEFFDFWSREDCLNRTLQGYFCKAFTSIYTNRPQKLLEYVFEHGIHQKMASCLSPSTSEMVYMCLCATYAEDNFLSSRLDLLEMVIQNLNGPAAANAKHIINKLVSDKLNVNTCEALIEFMLMEVNTDLIFACFNNQQAIPHACAVVETLLNAVEDNLTWKLSLLEAISLHLEAFSRILKNSDENRLGSARLGILQLLRTSLAHCTDLLAEQVCETEILAIASNLFVQFEWNSILHNVYVEIFTYALSFPGVSLKQHLIEDCKVLNMLKNIGENPYVTRGKQLFRRGTIGHVIKISNLLGKAAETDPFLNNCLQCEDWNNFKEVIESYNAVESKVLGGTNERGSSEDEEFLLEDNLTLKERDLGKTTSAGELAIKETQEEKEDTLGQDVIDLGDPSVNSEFYSNNYWKIVSDFTHEEPEQNYYSNTYWKISIEIDDLEPLS